MRTVAALLLLLGQAVPVWAQDFGHFLGLPITVAFIDPIGINTWERRVRLLAGVSYVDPYGKTWTVEPNFISDGASIPRLLWTVVGGPLDGFYRAAAVIHDKYCDTRSESYRSVHRMFYNAMRAAGVTNVEALTLYAGVMFGGPRWPDPHTAIGGRLGRDLPVDGPLPPPPPSEPARALTQADVDELKTFIISRSAAVQDVPTKGVEPTDSAYPSLDEIDAHVSQQLRRR